MELTYKVTVRTFRSENDTVLQYADNFEECYNTAWFWYSQTGKTAKISHNMTLALIADTQGI